MPPRPDEELAAVSEEEESACAARRRLHTGVINDDNDDDINNRKNKTLTSSFHHEEEEDTTEDSTEVTHHHQDEVNLKLKLLDPNHDSTNNSKIREKSLHQTLQQAQQAVRYQLQQATSASSTTTTVAVNDDDDKLLGGDGDQSPVNQAASEYIFKNLFETAGDFRAHLGNWPQCSKNTTHFSSPFVVDCVTGRFRRVRATLERHSVRHGVSLEVLTAQFLETRETSLRYTPLMCVFVVLRKLAAAIESMESTPASRNRLPVIIHGKEMEQNLIRVVKLLLLYGARPDARDVTGRTLVQYGTGGAATKSAAVLSAVDMCIGAAFSAQCFGKEVEIVNHATLHGRRGIAAGYQADTAQRLVYLFGQKGEVAVLNRNLRLVDPSSGEAMLPQSFNLCDVQDRLGRTALYELLDTNNVAVAEFLFLKHEASIDIPDYGNDGDTIRRLAFRGNNSSVCALIANVVMKRARSGYLHQQSCVNCGVKATKANPLRQCRACKSVKFCSTECQETHWKEGHKKECPILRTAYKECVVIKDPSPRNGDESYRITVVYSMGGDVAVTLFRRPSQVGVGEMFTVKVECMQGQDKMLVYDRSRECEFCVGPEQKAYKKLLAKVRSEAVTAGTKTYMSASFDKKGYCSLFLNQTKMKLW